MGLRLASLALLLLALCRTSSAADEKKVQDKLKDLVKPDKKAEFFANVDMMGVLFGAAAGLDSSFATGNPKKVIDNGVLCAFKNGGADLAKTVRTKMYGDNPTDLKAAEAAIIKELLSFACDSVSDEEKAKHKDDHKCLCQDGNTILYCAAEKYKKSLGTVNPGTCTAEALLTLKAAGNKELGNSYDYAQFDKNGKDSSKMNLLFKEEGSVDDLTKSVSTTDDAASKFFCDAINPEVEKAVKTLFESSVVYAFVEEATLALILGNGEIGKGLEDTANLCTKGLFKETEVGKCTCEGDAGLRFCAYKVLASDMKVLGYLNCDTTPKFVAEKKPEKKPTAALKKKEGGGGDGGSTAAPKPTEAPSPASAAATSSLLFAMLSAAAAMLLAH